MSSAWLRCAADRAALLAAAALFAVLALYLALPFAPSEARAAGPAGSVAVADLRGHALLLIDLARPGALARVALPGAPHELVELADGRIVASLGRAGALAVVTPASGHVEVLAIGGVPHGLAVAAGEAAGGAGGAGGAAGAARAASAADRGETLYVTDGSRGLVRTLRVADWSEGRPLPTGSLPHGVAVLAGGSLAVANAGDSTLQVGELVLAVAALPESVAVAPGRVAVATAHGGTIEVFDPSGTPLVHAQVDGRPVRVVFDTAGGLLAAALSASGEVALIDGGGLVRRVAVGGVPDGLAFSADGRWLLVGDLLGGSLAVVEVASGAVYGHIEAGVSAGAVLLLRAGGEGRAGATGATRNPPN